MQIHGVRDDQVQRGTRKSSVSGFIASRTFSMAACRISIET
jgi:hypothetical protein